MNRLSNAVLLATLSCAAIALTAEERPSRVCENQTEGAKIANPTELSSKSGSLEITLSLKSDVDDAGVQRFCYVTDHGAIDPTVRVQPGDKLVMHFKNDLPVAATAAPTHPHTSTGAPGCEGGAMTASTTNIHFHGTTLPPTCHQDDVLNTLLQPQQTFDYVLNIPRNEAPGLYWYHPHPHGFTELQVQGGASGALIVEGIERTYPELAALPQRVIVVRDPKLGAAQRALPADANKPSWDLSLNAVPIHYPGYVPAVIETRPKQREFWRVLNAGADVFLDLQVQVKGVPQPLQVFAIDGVPLPKASGALVQDTIQLTPGARVEFVVTTPDEGEHAQLITLKHDTGPAGDNDPARPIATIASFATAEALPTRPVASSKSLPPSSFDGLAAAPVVAHRRLVFAEENSKNDANTSFFIATDPGMHARFHFDDPPKFKVRQGTVEEWRIENRATEDHTFHIHQLHFQVLKINDVPVNDPALRDTVMLPYWTGKGPYASVTLRMDFRDPNSIGIVPFHCHILAHEDAGMMAKLEILPPAAPTQLTLSVSPAIAGAPVTLTARLTVLRKTALPKGFIAFNIDGGGHPIFTIENGVATYSTTFRAAGKHKISATYSGDDVYATSNSAEMELNVAPAHQN